MVDQSEQIINLKNEAKNMEEKLDDEKGKNFKEPNPIHGNQGKNKENNYSATDNQFGEGITIKIPNSLGYNTFSSAGFNLDNNDLTTTPYSNSKRQTKKSAERFECQEENCGKVFFDRGSFRKHQLTHGEKLFICKVCNKKFLDNSKLRRHSLVHSGEKNYKCDICGKKFSLDFNLRTHMRIHSGEKPYACVYPGCFKRFSQSSNLSAHEKTHEMARGGYDEALGRPIFVENPLKYLVENQYSGSETIENIKMINELYEMMRRGIANANLGGNWDGRSRVNQNDYYSNNQNNYNPYTNTNNVPPKNELDYSLNNNYNGNWQQSNRKVVFFQIIGKDKKPSESKNQNKNTNTINQEVPLPVTNQSLKSHSSIAENDQNSISISGHKKLFFTVRDRKKTEENNNIQIEHNNICDNENMNIDVNNNGNDNIDRNNNVNNNMNNIENNGEIGIKQEKDENSNTNNNNINNNNNNNVDNNGEIDDELANQMEEDQMLEDFAKYLN